MKKRDSSENLINNSKKQKTASAGRVALLWDESFLWGVMAFKALRQAGLGFELIRACDIVGGALSEYSMLFVPGGWASNKMKALGQDGVEAIRKFVFEGGHYLGFCGGAGLATQDGIGLLDIKRRPTKERVPSFSGRILLSTNAHELWMGTYEPAFHAWWPSQFVTGGGDVRILASYGSALPDAFSSDLNTGDIGAYGTWAELERIYGINLDPGRLTGEPAVVEGRYGKGTVVLSLIHFDTPGDENGVLLLKNLWKYLAGQEPATAPDDQTSVVTSGCEEATPVVMEILQIATDLISLGSRNFLWFWRNPMLLQWRRGVRGLEFCSLFILASEIASMSKGIFFDKETEERLLHVRDSLAAFAERAKELLVLERIAMTEGHITYETCEETQIRSLRKELFSTSKSHGGLFKDVISGLDSLLFPLMLAHNKPR